MNVVRQRNPCKLGLVLACRCDFLTFQIDDVYLGKTVAEFSVAETRRNRRSPVRREGDAMKAFELDIRRQQRPTLCRGKFECDLKRFDF